MTELRVVVVAVFVLGGKLQSRLSGLLVVESVINVLISKKRFFNENPSISKEWYLEHPTRSYLMRRVALSRGQHCSVRWSRHLPISSSGAHPNSP